MKIVKICTKKSSRFTTFFTLSFQNISISTKKQSFWNWPFVFSCVDISVDNLAPFVSCFVKWLSRPQPISQLLKNVSFPTLIHDLGKLLHLIMPHVPLSSSAHRGISSTKRQEEQKVVFSIHKEPSSQFSSTNCFFKF